MHKRVVIVGGGISGLAAAFFLLKDPSLRVTVLERSDRFGGVLKTLRPNEFPVESAADTFDGSRPGALELCRELGLSSKLIEKEPSLKKLFVRRRHQTFPVPFSPAVLASGALDLRAKARMILEPWIFPKKAASDESLGELIGRRFGRRFLDQAAGPLIRGVMMAEPEELSAREYFPPRKRGKKPEGKAWTLQGGMDRLVTALTERLQKNADLRLCTAVRSVTRETFWRVTLESGEVLNAEAVCLALPAYLSSGLLRDVAPEISGALSGIRYDSVAVVSFLFHLADVPPEWAYPGFIVPGPEERWPFSSLKLVGKDGAGLRVQAKVFISGAIHKTTYELSDIAILERTAAFLRREWNVPEPVWAVVERYPQALAQYETGHGGRISGIEDMLANYPGLFLTGNAYRGFGITDCVRGASAISKKMGLVA